MEKLTKPITVYGSIMNSAIAVIVSLLLFGFVVWPALDYGLGRFSGQTQTQTQIQAKEPAVATYSLTVTEHEKVDDNSNYVHISKDYSKKVEESVPVYEEGGGDA